MPVPAAEFTRRRDEAVDHRIVELLLPGVAQLGLFNVRQAVRHSAPHLVDGLLIALRVLLQQDVDGDGLFVEEELGLV